MTHEDLGVALLLGLESWVLESWVVGYESAGRGGEGPGGKGPGGQESSSGNYGGHGCGLGRVARRS